MKLHFPWIENSEIGEGVPQRTHEMARVGDWDHTAQHNLHEAHEVLEELQEAWRLVKTRRQQELSSPSEED